MRAFACEKLGSHFSNLPITKWLQVSHFTFQFYDWPIQATRIKDFEPCYLYGRTVYFCNLCELTQAITIFPAISLIIASNFPLFFGMVKLLCGFDNFAINRYPSRRLWRRQLPNVLEVRTHSWRSDNRFVGTRHQWRSRRARLLLEPHAWAACYSRSQLWR